MFGKTCSSWAARGRRHCAVAVVAALSAFVGAAQAPVNMSAPGTILIDGRFLAAERRQADDDLIASVRHEAERAMKQEPVSVMDKTQVPPSGDKHDYTSLAPYFWPNPDTPDHLPYVRKDGEHNPEARLYKDHEHFSAMTSAVHALALGYFFTGKEEYAEHASLLLRVWFLDVATRMNPNLEYAQAVRGKNTGRGTGILDVRGLADVVDALALLANSKAWTRADDAAMHAWCDQYFAWLTTSRNGRDEAGAKNNHGSWYDVQAEALAIYLGKTDAAKTIAETAKTKRIAVQIEPDGAQPMEEARTNSFGYSTFNMSALMRLATISQTVGVDLWSYRAPHGGSIRTMVDYLTPYALQQKSWTRQTIKGFNPGEVYEPLLMAAVGFRNAYDEADAKALKSTKSVQAMLLEREFGAVTKAGEKGR